MRKLELELAEKEIMKMEQKIVSLEDVSSIYNAEDLNDAERELHDWCEMMEKRFGSVFFFAQLDV